MDTPPNPQELTFQEDYDTIDKIVTKKRETLTGHGARVYNLAEFNRVMGESGLNRDETVYVYGKSLANEKEPGANLRHQAESAEGAYSLMRMFGLPDRPFSWQASKALLDEYVRRTVSSIPDSLPDGFGDDGPTTV